MDSAGDFREFVKVTGGGSVRRTSAGFLIRPGKTGRPVLVRPRPGSRTGIDGGAEPWTTVCSLITTAKLNDIEPFAHLKDILERMSAGHSMSRINELLPWNWRPSTALN